MRRSFAFCKLARKSMAIAVMTINLFLLMVAFPIRQDQPEYHFQLLPLLRFAQLLQPAQAQQQSLRMEEAAPQVYRLLPELPLENQYIDRENGKVSEDNTLLSRLIRYHVYVKGRPFSYRLDWKLTLADYLGANERISPETYPSGDALKTNPLAGDRAAIGKLSRIQRDELVRVLVSVFAPISSQSTTPQSAPTVTPSSSPTPAAPSPLPSVPPPLRSPQPGDAQLLSP